MFDLKICKYAISEKSYHSIFWFNLTNNVNKNVVSYELKLPLNPLIDIEILELFEFSFEEKISKLNNLVKNKKYSFKTIESINNFLLWIKGHTEMQINV